MIVGAIALCLIAATETSTTATITTEVIYVRAPRIRAEPTQVRMLPDEARRIPGTQGDSLKVVQNLPGVARAQLGSGSLIVWGAAPSDTRVAIDGLSVPALYHLGGVRSTLSSELVQAIELVPGAYSQEYGRGLGGLVRVTTKDLDPYALHAVAAIDLLDASAMISTPLGKRARVAIAGRYGWLDRVLSSFDDDIGALFPIPRYSDYQAKATLELRDDESISLLFLGSHDRLERTANVLDPKERSSETNRLDFHRLSLHYERLLADGSTVMIAPGIGFDLSARELESGGVPASLEERAFDYGLRAAYRTRVTSSAVVSMGIDAEGTRVRVARSGSLNVPAREGDLYVFGRPPGADVAADRYHVELADVAPFASVEWELGPLRLAPGLRLDAYAFDGDHLLPPSASALQLGFFRTQLVFEPRLAADLRISEDVTLHAAGGVYHQAPSPLELSSIFGTPSLEVSSALQTSVGATVRLGSWWSIEGTAFFKTFDQLVTRAAAASPKIAHALTEDGSGRAFGAQLLLRKELSDGLSGWLSYAITRSERRDADALPLRAFDYDQTHLLSAVISWELEEWVFGARVRLASGFPRTPIDGAYLDLLDDRWDPIFAEQNTSRIPAFFQADVRVERIFEISGAKLSIYLDLENITFRKNVEELAYSLDYSEQQPITGLPFLGVLGARIEL